MDLFGVAVNCADCLGRQTLHFGDVRRRVALLLSRPTSEELVELLACKNGEDDANAELRLGIRSKVLG